MPLSLTDSTPAVEAAEPASSSAAAVAAFLGRCAFAVLSGRSSPETIRGHFSPQALSSLLAIRLREARSPDCRLRSVHACPITRSRVEACVLVGAHRVRALVLRAEWTAGRWSCTRLSLV